MMNILSKIHINLSFLLIILLGLITGLFKEIIIFSSIIIIHEIGHLVVGLLMKKEVESISLYIFGGYIKFKGYVNTSFFEDFIISIAGFLFQTLYYLVIMIFYKLNIVTDDFYYLFKEYHLAILLFNLIPIYPLDGAALFKVLIMWILPFKLAHQVVIYTSFIMSVVVLILSIIYNLSLNYILIFILLIKEIFSEYKNHNMVFNKFLLERHLYKFDFKKKKIFTHNKLKRMYKGRYHTFKDNLGYRTEKQVLNKKFDFK